MAIVPSHLPHLRLLYLERSHRIRNKYVEELKAAVPELKVGQYLGDTVPAMRNKHLETTYKCGSSDADGIIRQRVLPAQSEDWNCNH
jgi:hypothetical protein